MKNRNRTHKAIMVALCYGGGKRRLAHKYGWRRVKVAWKGLQVIDIGYALS